MSLEEIAMDQLHEKINRAMFRKDHAEVARLHEQMARAMMAAR